MINIKIDLTRIVPPNCLGPKCVYRTRVMSATAFALKLLSMKELTVENLRRIAPISPKQGKRLPVIVRKLALAVMDYIDGDPSTAVELVMSDYPPEVRDYVKEKIESVISDPLGYIEKNRMQVDVGWRVIASPETTDPMFIPREWFWYIVEYLSSVEANFRPDIVLCSVNECYPLPLGLYPHRLLLGFAFDTGKIDLLYERLHRKYGATILAEALDKLDIKEIAFVVTVKKTTSRVAFFLHVDNARETAVRLASYQNDALELEEEMLKQRLGEGFEKLELDEYKIKTIIRDVLKEEGILR